MDPAPEVGRRLLLQGLDGTWTVQIGPSKEQEFVRGVRQGLQGV